MFKKQHHKSKEELIKDAETQKEVIRKRKIVKETLYPFLLNTSKSIDDSQVFCQSVAIAINQAFNNKKKDFKIKDLDLIGKLNLNGAEYQRYKDILDLFAEENIQDAVEVINGMSDVIGSFIREETTERPLNSLKATLL